MLKILVVDENPDWQDAIGSCLDSNEYQLIQIPTKDEARQILQSTDDVFQDLALILLATDLDNTANKDREKAIELLKLTTPRWEKEATNVIIMMAGEAVDEMSEFESYPQIATIVFKGSNQFKFQEQLVRSVRKAVKKHQDEKLKLTALVVEDRSDWRMLLTDLLKKEGFTVITASTEEAARNILTSGDSHYQELDLIVLDLRLKEWGEGYEGMSLLELTTPHWERNKTNVIISTAYGWVNHADQAFEYPQVRQFIPKAGDDTDGENDFYDAFQQEIKIIRQEKKEQMAG